MEEKEEEELQAGVSQLPRGDTPPLSNNLQY